MDRKKTKKIQSTRIVMTNIFMALSVIAIVFILMLIAMGFKINEHGGLEQSGLLQISSHPSGATVEIDGETQFSRTEISKMLSSGEHKVKVTKSGYDTWETNVRVDAGLLTHISWVRLFPLNPTTEKVATYNQAKLLSFSNDRKNLLYLEQGSTSMKFINLQGDSIKEEKIKLSDVLGTKDADVLQNAVISVAAWSDGSNKALINWTHGEITDWILLDIENPTNSINLTNKFGLYFNNILIANGSASKLWAIENGNLHLIDLSNSTISVALATGIETATNNKDVIAYIHTAEVAAEDGNTATKRTVELFKEGETGATVIEDITKAKANNTTLALGTYWSDEWLAYSTDANLTILAGKYPSFDKPAKNAMKDVLKRELSHVPTSISVNAEQRIVAYRSPAKVMSFDFETKDYYDIQLKSENKSYWLDDYIIWQHEEGKVTINDFNGNNYRELISDSNNQLPVCLTENNRWLYYFDVVEKETKTEATEGAETTETTPAEETTPAIKYVLMREKLNI